MDKALAAQVQQMIMYYTGLENLLVIFAPNRVPADNTSYIIFIIDGVDTINLTSPFRDSEEVTQTRSASVLVRAVGEAAKALLHTAWTNMQDGGTHQECWDLADCIPTNLDVLDVQAYQTAAGNNVNILECWIETGYLYRPEVVFEDAEQLSLGVKWLSEDDAFVQYLFNLTGD